jgi:uncharacterized protein involved in outer membrane biogenesis
MTPVKLEEKSFSDFSSTFRNFVVIGSMAARQQSSTVVKRVLIAALVLGGLCAGVIITVMMNFDAIATHIKPKLEQLAEKALSSKVSIAEFHPKILPNAEITLGQVTIQPLKGGEGLTFDTLHLGVSLLPLLSSKVEVRDLSIENPVITIVQEGDTFRIAGLPSPQAETDTPKTPRNNSDAVQKPTQKEPADSNLAIALNHIMVNGLNLKIKPQKEDSSQSIALVDLASKVEITDNKISADPLKVTGTFLDAPIEVSGTVTDLPHSGSADLHVELSDLALTKTAALLRALGFPMPIELGGHANVRLHASGALKKPRLDLTLNFDESSLLFPNVFEKKIGDSFSLENSFTVLAPKQLDGQTELAVSHLQLLATGAVIDIPAATFNLRIRPKVNALRAQAIALEITGQPLSLSITAQQKPEQIEIEKFDIQGFGGELKTRAYLTPAQSTFDMQANGSGLSIQAIRTALLPNTPIPVEGTLKQIALKLTGRLGSDLQHTLAGTFDISLQDGTIKGFNFVRELLQTLRGLEGLLGDVFKTAKLPAALNSEEPDTKIQALTMNGTIAQGVLHIRSFELNSALFNLRGHGSVGQAGELDLATTVHFNSSVSASLIASAKELKNLQESPDGSVVIPLVIKGKIPNVVLLPDVGELAKVVGKKVIADKIGDLLSDALKSDSKKGGKGLGDLLGF